MLKVFKILFLSISILFSFGYTTYEAKCEQNEKKECVKKMACCYAHEKTTKDCGNQCLKPVSLWHLNDFSASNHKIEITNISNFILVKKGVDRKLLVKIASHQNFSDNYFEPKESPPHLSEIQCWLI